MCHAREVQYPKFKMVYFTVTEKLRYIGKWKNRFLSLSRCILQTAYQIHIRSDDATLFHSLSG